MKAKLSKSKTKVQDNRWFEFSNNGRGFSCKIFGFHINLFRGSKKHYQDFYKVAVVTAARTPVIQKTQQAFITALRANSFLNYRFTLFNAHGNSTNTRKHLEEIIEEDYDLIFTIGTQCTVMAKEVTHHRRKAIPIVFCGVWNPEFYGLVESEESSENNVTGVKCEEKPRYIEQINLLLSIKPEIKTIVAFSDPLSYLEKKDNLELKNHFAKKDIDIKLVDIINKNDCIAKAHEHISNTDAIIPLRNTVAMSCIEELVNLCNKHKVTLFSSDLPSVERGAALGYGDASDSFELECARKVMAILEEQKRPSQIPVTDADLSYKMVINPKTMNQQGLNINPHLLALLKRGETTS